MMTRSFAQAVLACAVALGMTGIAQAAEPAPAQGAVGGVLAPQRILQVGLVLKPQVSMRQQQAAVEQWLTRDGGDPLLRGQLARASVASTRDIAQVKAYLSRYGITDVRPATDGRLLQVRATAAALQAALGAPLRAVSADGRVGVAAAQGAVAVPAGLQAVVQGVVGLDGTAGAKVTPHGAPLSAARASLSNSNAVTAASSGGAEVVRHSIEELNSAYGADTLAPASDIVGAVIAAGNLENTLARLQSFQALHGLHTPVTVGDPGAPGYQSNAASKDSEVEWDMDTQLLVGSAGGLKRLIIYNIPDFSWNSIIDGMARAADDNLARVVSMSIYGQELQVNDAVFQAMDASLTKAVRQGQNVVICSGDDGVYLPLSARANAPYYDSLAGRPDLRQVGWPASHRYAIAVGATELLTQGGNPGRYASERVWNAGVGRQLSQGGVSKIAYAPQWQRTLLPGQTASGYRAVPDVSFNGSFYSSAQIRGTDAQGNEAAWYVWGTSAATPTFAGYIARLLQSHPNLGFVAPQIYQYASQRHDAQRAHDVVVGSNGLYRDGYNASYGWDFASGWGSMNIGDFDRFLTQAAP
ncbi:MULTISPECIES: S53 family peptidase [Xanthomonas]|uniref:S53 family peptidase n=1 Tax=Xanthomonas TaxID=338 RepID=UPI001ADCF596|nr:S53 family peptidase [Xanthomonas phaseoli]MBO9767304.1 S8 family serine peptidase [Xanthomonas phaseoli pv. dieffenbachiae]MBO9774980.1 S8 family serine peptidase [Xanthomonas phaseoli pv. dieffenbachiae]MBO9779290.1 S8 family serine peptidase [Xanthomonas phaseoli pv. dieffenbachiae]MBO9795586.1 S8 family serine peptidase [Xanthomonas phaseoli pv. dieffenbachiae]MBO9799538.1 S8 family serine peptidase [Xanthomonas phaseoli pv. dieffenbachiae]